MGMQTDVIAKSMAASGSVFGDLGRHTDFFGKRRVVSRRIHQTLLRWANRGHYKYLPLVLPR